MCRVWVPRNVDVCKIFYTINNNFLLSIETLGTSAKFCEVFDVQTSYWYRAKYVINTQVKASIFKRMFERPVRISYFLIGGNGSGPKLFPLQSYIYCLVTQGLVAMNKRPPSSDFDLATVTLRGCVCMHRLFLDCLVSSVTWLLLHVVCLFILCKCHRFSSVDMKSIKHFQSMDGIEQFFA